MTLIIVYVTAVTFTLLLLKAFQVGFFEVSFRPTGLPSARRACIDAAKIIGREGQLSVRFDRGLASRGFVVNIHSCLWSVSTHSGGSSRFCSWSSSLHSLHHSPQFSYLWLIMRSSSLYWWHSTIHFLRGFWFLCQHPTLTSDNRPGLQLDVFKSPFTKSS